MKRDAGFWCRWMGISACLVWLSGVAQGAVLTNASSVIDGAGGWATGGSFSNISAAAQPSGVAVSTAGSLVNYAGFLSTFVLRPALDSDGDGCANEFDPDNDNDGVNDSTEIAGTAFNPLTATAVNVHDSDGDGASDGDEAAAGTDPWDTNALLRIVSLGVTNCSTIAWIARSNVTYCIARSTNLMSTGGGFTGVDTITVHVAASSPWYVVTNEYTDALSPITNEAIYRIEVR